MVKRGWVAGIVVLAVWFAVPAVAQAATDALVTNGSPSTLFPRNKQNEPAIAVNPRRPNVLAAGTNEEIDEPPCDGNSCPFVQGVGNSGVYFSFDGGTSWTQPTYQGYSDRSGTPGTGPIGTLPHYDDAGLVSDGDPGLAFGPRRKNGVFRWRNGARLYYSNLASNFSTVRSEATFRGFEAIAVSHADRLHAAASDHASAWSGPVIVTQRRQSQTTFSDKPAIAVDTARTSPHFGSVYSCYSRFNSQNPIGPIKIGFSRSTNGGRTFSRPKDLSAAASQPTQDGRQGCSVATDSQGVVYVAWEDIVHKQSVFKIAKSFDGGRSFGKPSVVAPVTDVGVDDQVRSFSFDGIAGARTSSFPSLSIANGAPSGIGAPDTLALGWSDASDGLNHEHALVQLSGNGGRTWNGPTAVEASGDRPDFAFLGISPNGQDLYVVYDGFTDPFRTDTASTRRFVGVVRHADVSGTSLSGLATLDRGTVGDARASSANGLIDEFIGDYNAVAATNARAVAVYNDASNAAVCTKIDDFRQEVVDTGTGAQFGEEEGEAPPGGTTAPEAPAPGTDCPATFGNTDIYSAAAADPTP
ncbi:MAG: glycoside hydrolase [Actinobacteria bacterium]|nr:glycoside hydrolase [Actinomycetota bacterium]